MKAFRAWPAALCVLLSCVDPRARPVPPKVVIQLPASLSVHSPGTLPHTVYAFDPDGLERIRVIVQASDSLIRIDSTRAPADFSETTENYIWSIPSGLQAGTSIRIIAIATDFIGLVSADTTVVVVN